MTKSYADFISEIDHSKYGKAVMSSHVVDDIEDYSQDPSNFLPLTNSKKSVLPKGKHSVKEDVSVAISDTTSDIYTCLQRLDIIADQILYSDQHSKVSLFIHMLQDVIKTFDQEYTPFIDQFSINRRSDTNDDDDDDDDDVSYESFAPGKFKFDNGDSTQLTIEQCEKMNKIVVKLKSASKLAKKNIKEFQALLDLSDSTG